MRIIESSQLSSCPHTPSNPAPGPPGPGPPAPGPPAPASTQETEFQEFQRGRGEFVDASVESDT